MADKIRLGILGANIHRGWAPRSHLPAIVASPEFELIAVCKTRMESVEESREKFRARLAFEDYHEMLAHPEHVYAEWPLIYNSNGSSTSSGRAEPAASPLMVSLLNQHFEMASTDSRE